jgi:hypothetical protein
MQQAAEEKRLFVIEGESYELRSKIEDLKGALPEQAALLEGNLDKIRGSKTKQDLLEGTNELKELSESKQFEDNFETDEFLEVSGDAGQQGRVKIDLLPGYVVLPVKSSLVLKNVAVFDYFIKEVSPELEWFSSNPSVAFVDQSGIVYAKNAGKAEITCRYKGFASKKSKITVVETISKDDRVVIRREIGI